MIPISIVICPNKECKTKCKHRGVHKHNDFCDVGCYSLLKEVVLSLGCVPYDGVQPTERTPG